MTQFRGVAGGKLNVGVISAGDYFFPHLLVDFMRRHPGVTLNFSPSPDPVVGTPGRAVDHIGFEVKNLEAFTKKLQADGIKLDRPYTKVAALDIAIAFITDPWGTSIELTEGLDRVQ